MSKLNYNEKIKKEILSCKELNKKESMILKLFYQ